MEPKCLTEAPSAGIAANERTPLRRLIAIGAMVAVSALAGLATTFLGPSEWRQTETTVIAVVVTGVALAFAFFLLHREATHQRLVYRTLREIEGRIGGIIESAMDAIITVDPQHRIVLFNGAAERVFRWPRSAVIGQPLDLLLPERYRTVHRQHIERFGHDGATSRRMGGQTVLTGLRADGEEFPVEASISQSGEQERKLYTVILRDVTRRVQDEQALRQSKEELRRFTAAADQLREQEKRRIARELHDELAQALTGIKMDLAWIKDKLPSPPEAVTNKLKNMENLLDATVSATRRISSDLRPMMLDDLGLIPAIEWLAQNFTERTGIRCQLSISNPELPLHDPYATTLYRALQESLTNVAKHAQASRVDVELHAHNGEIIVTVTDDGKGFSQDDSRKSDSYGLIGMRERVYLVGGTCRVDSSPGRGTRVEVRITAPEENP